MVLHSFCTLCPKAMTERSTKSILKDPDMILVPSPSIGDLGDWSVKTFPFVHHCNATA